MAARWLARDVDPVSIAASVGGKLGGKVPAGL
jgi:hypothetical protein